MANALKSTNFIAGWLGVLAVAVVIVAILMSAATSDWEFGLNSISDLGVQDGSLIFNAGLIVGGVLLLAYGAGRASCDAGLYGAGSICTALAGIGLVMLAVFNLDMGSGYMHYLFAVWAALFLAVAIIVNSVQLWKDGGNRRIIAGVAVAVFMISIVTFIVMTPAEWQTYTVFAALAWFILDIATYLASGLNTKKVAE